MTTKRTPSILKTGGGLLGLGAVLCILIAATVIAGHLRLRADMTSENLYTLSDGTRALLGGLERPVTLKLFFNSSNPRIPVHLKNYARRVEDLLREYRSAGNGLVRIDTFDPEPDSEHEEWARRYGVAEQPLGLTGPSLYFGVVAVMGEQEAVMPALDPRTETLLEYNITRLIHRVGNPQRPVVGIISSLPVLGRASGMPFAMPNPEQDRAWVAFDNLGQDVELREITVESETLPSDLDVLILFHPKDLPAKLLFAVDQYILAGGRAIVCVDPMSLADMDRTPPPQFGPPRASSDLGVLFDAWGLGYDPQRILADVASASRVRIGGGRVDESPVWLTLAKQQLNSDNVLTAGLEMMMVPYAGGLSDETGDTLTLTPLLRASAGAGFVDSMTSQFGSQAILRSLKKSDTPLSLAVTLSGQFPTAFPDGIPDQDDPDTGVPAGLQAGESTVIVVSDIDFLADDFCVQALNFFGQTAYQPINDNIAFLANTVEMLSGGDALIGIRSRGQSIRPFERVLMLEREARKAWKDREDALMARLEATQQKLREMQTHKDTSQQFILSDEQRRAINEFQAEEIRIRDELKDVRKTLRHDIERLGVVVKTLNIALVPGLVGLAGISFGIYRSRRQ
jgi:ABC-type uncharacterized transport system involved in gliding motility auxiliary subunit